MAESVDIRGQGWSRTERLLFCSILVAAAAVRVWNLGGLPAGLHGDEAWTGLDARRILAEGWIGPYVPSALGQPTGPLYVVAGLLLILPDDIATVRLGIAIFGVLGVLFTYLAAREYGGPALGAFAAVLLTGCLWHLHASRTGFMFVSCPAALMAALWLQALAIRKDSWQYFAAAGFAAGLGIYTYNAYPTALPLFAVPFVYSVSKRDQPLRRWLWRPGIFAAAAFVAAMPMLHYLERHSTDFFRHHKLVSLFASPTWKDADWSARAHFLWDRVTVWLTGVAVQGQFDAGDGYGVGGIPLIDPTFAGLALLGGLLALLRWRRPLSGLLLAALPLLSTGALITIGAGTFRRTIGLAPILSILAALPLAALWETGWRAHARWGWAPHLVLAALAIGLAGTSVQAGLRSYFGPFVHNERFDWIYARDLRVTGEYLATIPSRTRVFFYSERWSCRYETLRYLAPDIECIDRSRRYAVGLVSGERLDFHIQPNTPSIFVLMGTDVRRQRYVDKLYPDARPHIGKLDGRTVFAALHLPEGAPPTPPQHTATTAAPIDPQQKLVSLTQLEPLDVRYDFVAPRSHRSWNGAPLRIGGRRFTKGIGMHAPTEVVYPVPPGSVMLTTRVGLSDEARKCAKASVRFEVRDQKGRVLADSGVMRADSEPQTLRAPLKGVGEIVLVAGDAGDGRDCDHANWGNPLIRRTVMETAMQPVTVNPIE